MDARLLLRPCNVSTGAGVTSRAARAVREQRVTRKGQPFLGPVSRNSRDEFARAPDILSDAEWSAVASELCLSRREAQMVHQANYDESVSAIAERLGVSPHTVHTYRERLYRKLRSGSGSLYGLSSLDKWIGGRGYAAAWSGSGKK